MIETQTTKDLLWNDPRKHLAEAQVLWPRWQAGLAAHDETLRSVAAPTEERLLAHLAGLRPGGLKTIVELLLPALATEDLGRLSATAYAMAAMPPGRESLLAAILAARGPRLAALRRGVELARDAGFVALCEARFDGAPLPVRAALLDVRRSWKEDPGPHTLALLLSDDPAAQVAAARAVRFQRSELAINRAIEVAMMATRPDVRNAALESGLFTGHPEAWSACLQTIRAGAPGSGPLMLLVALLGTLDDQALVIDGLAAAETRQEAVWALGFAGSRAAADACIDLLAQDLHPRLAAEALGAITGLDLARQDLALPEEPGSVSPEDRLPMPDIPGVIRWWNLSRPRFAEDQRTLAGRPRSADAIQEALERGPTRRRAPLALELAIRTARRYLVVTDAFTAQQRQEMVAFAALEPADFRRHPDARQFSPV
jgi:uncharacterized protein (TIGR02270 family)